MPTPLTKPVARKDPATQLVVTVAPEGLYLRESRRRKEYGPLPWSVLYLQAVRATVDAEKRAKVKAKGAGKRTPVKRGML